MEVKSIIDTIREDKNLEDDHDLSLSSNHLDLFLDAFEIQLKQQGVKLNIDDFSYDEDTKQM